VSPACSARKRASACWGPTKRGLRPRGGPTARGARHRFTSSKRRIATRCMAPIALPRQSRKSYSRRAARTHSDALRLGKTIRAAHRERAEPNTIVRPPARARPRLPGARHAQPASRASMPAPTLTSLRRGQPRREHAESPHPPGSGRQRRASPTTTYPHFWGQLCGRFVDNPFRSYGGPLYRLFSTVCSVEKSRIRAQV
jgi:hypothetical protein